MSPRLPESVPAAVREALAVLFPVDCAGCFLPDHALCPACRSALAARPARSVLADGTPVVSAVRYEDVVRRLLLAYKEQGRTDLARPLAAPLAAAVEEAARLAAGIAGPVPLELCAVPASRRSRSRRGYRPVALLLRAARLREADILRAAAGHREQKSLGREERERNLAGAFGAAGALDGRAFVLVDDILTTGATLVEAARVVRARGGRVLAAATLALTPRRHPADSAS